MAKNPLSVRTLARCGIGSCPAVYDNEDGTFTVVGDKVEPDAELAKHIAGHEQAVRIDAGLLYQAALHKFLHAGPAGLAAEDNVFMIVFANKTLFTKS